jgi:gluconolactonase
MKQSLACICVLLIGAACSSSSGSGNGGSSGSGASAGASVSGGAGGAVNGSAGSNATAGTSGSAAGTSGLAGAGGTAGAAGAAGAAGSGGSGFIPYKCPAGPFDALDLGTATPKQVPGAPPVGDGFITQGYANVEGPVWIGDSLYFSEMQVNIDRPPARILKLAPSGQVTVAVTNSGSNGLAVDPSGILTAARHADGSISQIALPGGTITPIVTGYDGAPFIAPNDLAIRTDGTIYFSDTNFQNMGSQTQSAQRLYWVTPARVVAAITGAPTQPNGVTLSLDEKTLYVSGSALMKFTVMTDGSLTNPTAIPGGSSGGGDGMVMDCAGDLFVAGNGMVQVFVGATGTPKTIPLSGATNVAFGGTDHKTLYLTAQGTDGQRGVYSLPLNIPGMPY